jgi:hypothetical protein
MAIPVRTVPVSTVPVRTAIDRLPEPVHTHSCLRGNREDRNAEEPLERGNVISMPCAWLRP